MNEVGPIASAFALHAAGALADAEAAYRRILAVDPRHAVALHYLGVLRHQLGDSQTAVSLIRQALDADGGSASRYNDLGNILVQVGDSAGAAAAFRSSIEFNPDDPNVWNNLGSVLRHQRELAGAETALRGALRCDVDFVAALNNLAELLMQTGREEESSLLTCRAFVLPPFDGKPQKMLGIAYYRLGRFADAAECYRAWLRAEPDSAVARHYLAACSGQDVPARASDAFVTAVFDEMADGFDQKLVGALSYRGPQIIAGLLDGQVPANRALEVLDGGCGTGLCAPLLAPYAGRLVGVDLSPRMLAKAMQRNLYDELVEMELAAFLSSRKHSFDLIVMADTLIYFGDLAELFTAVAQALRAAGTFAFTIEVATESGQRPIDFNLSPSGRYGHSLRYLSDSLDAAGLALVRSDDVVLRSEFCRPTPGLGVLARSQRC